MSRSLLLRGLRTSSLAVAVAAVAIVIFGNAEFPAALVEGKFWTTLGAAGLGGFIGGLLMKERGANSR